MRFQSGTAAYKIQNSITNLLKKVCDAVSYKIR